MDKREFVSIFLILVIVAFVGAKIYAFFTRQIAPPVPIQISSPTSSLPSIPLLTSKPQQIPTSTPTTTPQNRQRTTSSQVTSPPPRTKPTPTPAPVFVTSPVVTPAQPAGILLWPIGCVKGQTCGGMGYPDINKANKSFDCSVPNIFGHSGTDIGISWQQMDAGMPVYAAMNGTVLWAWDGKYDRCPDNTNRDCVSPVDPAPGSTEGNTVCTALGPYCSKSNNGLCYWCFASGNTIFIQHDHSKVFLTSYGHLKNGSVLVKPGDIVKTGQKIAEVGSSGSTSGPHLHFEVWEDYYKAIDPWAGKCGPNFNNSLW